MQIIILMFFIIHLNTTDPGTNVFVSGADGAIPTEGQRST